MFLTPLFQLMADKQASDLFISAGAPVSIKILGTIMPVNQQIIDPDTARKVAYEIMSEKQIREFEDTLEMNFSYVVQKVGRFRVNVFRQRNNVAMVIRYLKSGTAGIDKLKKDGIISGGMIPKVDSALESLRGGVGKVHLIDGRIPHALILEIFTDVGIGTEILL